MKFWFANPFSLTFVILIRLFALKKLSVTGRLAHQTAITEDQHEYQSWGRVSVTVASVIINEKSVSNLQTAAAIMDNIKRITCCKSRGI